MSYNTIVEADAYFLAGYGYTKWDALTDPTKQQALESAQQQLDNMCIWYGEPTEEDQDNAFPRDGDTEVPEDVKTAELEIAYAIVDTGSTSTDSGDPLSELKAGSVTLKFDAGASSNPLINDLTDKLLTQYGICGGSGSTKLVPMERQ